MEKRFEVKILDEAREYLKSLPEKHYEKILYNIRKAQVENDPELFKNSLTIFGSLELYIKVYNIGFLPFGTRLPQQKLL